MMGCPACGGNAWSPFLVATDMYTGMPHAILHCDHCGLARTADDGDASPGKLYVYGGSFDAGERFGPMQWVLRAFRRARLRAIPTRRPGRVLDIGCGDGSFLEALARQGWEIFGTELSEPIAATARKRLGEGLRVGTIEKVGFAAASFDLVTFWHVLEHLDDPRLALSEARRLLRANGRVVVAAPNIESLQACIFKEGWLHLDVPRHHWHFSPRTLAAVADRCDLRVESIRHFSLEYGPFAIVQGAATKAGLGYSLFTRLVRLPLPQLLREPLFWAHIPVLAFAIIPSVLLELGAAICGRGGAVVMVFRPKD
jgi:SAM-dependent methyltransferase